MRTRYVGYRRKEIHLKLKTKSKHKKDEELQWRYLQDILQNEDGRYEVKLPWISEKLELSANYGVQRKGCICYRVILIVTTKYSRNGVAKKSWKGIITRNTIYIIQWSLKKYL